MEGRAYRCDSERRRGPWVKWWLGGGGWRSRVVLPISFIVVVAAALQVFTLNVPSTVVCARELNAILVHTPANTSFATTRRLAL